MKFEINQLVVALTNPQKINSQPRVKGQIYKVKNIMYCSKCGVQMINVTELLTVNKFLECTCGGISNNNSMYWTQSPLFAPLTKQYLKECEEKEDYETCVLIQKLIK